MATSFYARYPSASGGANPANGPTGIIAPTTATEVGFVANDTGFLEPFSGATAASGPNVTVTSSTLPAGAATEATLLQVQANQTNGTQHTIVDSSALPTGAATQSTLSTLNAKTAGALVPTAFDEIDLTYVPSGNGVGQVQTATYKLASATVKTLTLTYDASNRVSTVVAS